MTTPNMRICPCIKTMNWSLSSHGCWDGPKMFRNIKTGPNTAYLSWMKPSAGIRLMFWAPFGL